MYRTEDQLLSIEVNRLSKEDGMEEPHIHREVANLHQSLAQPLHIDAIKNANNSKDEQWSIECLYAEACGLDLESIYHQYCCNSKQCQWYMLPTLKPCRDLALHIPHRTHIAHYNQRYERTSYEHHVNDRHSIPITNGVNAYSKYVEYIIAINHPKHWNF